MSQCEVIIKHLQDHVGITGLEAAELYGIQRLAARIYVLRERGYKILSFEKDVFNRLGKKCRVSEYRLLKEEQK